MAIQKLLVILIFATSLKSSLEVYNFELKTADPAYETLGLSVTEIGKNYYLKNTSYLNIFKSIKSENIYKFYDVLDTVINIFKLDEIAFQIEDVETLSYARNIRRFLNFLFIDSVESFENVIKNFVPSNFRTRKVFTIVSITELKFEDKKRIFDLLFEKYLISVNILTFDSNQVLNLFTFFPFKSPSNCSNTSPVKISTFNKTSGKWSNSKNFYNRKTNDLMGCRLRIGCAVVSSEPAMMYRKHENGTIEMYGVEKDMFDEFSRRLNFTADYIPYFNGVGSVYPNGTGFGVLGSVLSNEFDVGIGFVSLQYVRTLFLSESRYYRTDALMLVVPPGEEYGSLEKLLLPFDFSVWFVFFFVFATSIIFSIISFKFPIIYRFVIGSEINQPVMNMVAVHLGVSQPKLPSRNFSRFILMNFLVYCLILRSAYQGSFFNTMVSNKSKPPVATIEEMVQKKFTLYAFETLGARLSDFSFYNHVKRYPNIQISNHRQMTLNPDFKGAVFSYESQTLYLNQINRKNFTYTLSKEHLMSSSLVFYFRKDHYLVPRINEILDNFLTHGIVDFITSKYADKRYLKLKPDGGRKVLEINRLYGAIEIYFLCTFISVLIFIIELATKYKRFFCRKKR